MSNIDDDQFDPLWEQMALGHLFHATTTSEEARSCKPHPGIYRLALEKAGRDPASLARMVLTGVGLRAGLDSPGAFEDTLGAYAEAGVTDLVVHWPRPEGVHAGDLDRFERVIGAVRGG